MAKEDIIKEIKKKKRNSIINKWVRIVIQIVFFLTYPAVFSQGFSGFKEMISSIGKGATIEINTFLIRFIVLVIITVVFGRIFCGYACAFGALGDWLYGISLWVQKKAKKIIPAIPLNIVVVLQKLKYVVLFGILLVCFTGNSDFITKYSPWTVFSMMTVGKFDFKGYGVAVTIILVIIIGMIVKERFFCQFLCPFGAIFTILPSLPFVKLKRKKEGCIKGCKACKMQCPVNIKIGENCARDGECISCMRCKFTCPKNNIGIMKK